MGEVDNQPKKQLGGATGKGFIQGKSGNPKGRPKKKKCIPDILRELTKAKTTNNITKLEQMLSNIVENAIAGDPFSITFVADRMEGRPAQIINQTIEELPSGFTTKRI